ncbi:MAG: hypothetical protein Kow0031_32650 [Anaerolineae bacterium]
MSDLACLDGACWIGPAHPFDLHEAYLNFRSPPGWRLEAAPRQAALLISADSRYRLWVNGRFVARGPARAWPHAQAVDRLDVTAHLRPGPNTLAVEVYQPGYSHFAYVHRGAAGLLAGLLLDGDLALQTDTTWRVRRDPSCADRVPRVSIYGSGVEERNLRQADDWPGTTYDDSSWDTPRIVAPAGGYPWTGLRLRDIPFLAERDAPLALLETRRGPAPAVLRTDPHRALREGWAAAAPDALRPDADGGFAVSLAAGEAAYWLLDLGRDYTVQGRADIEGAGGGERLSISYHEKIRDGELVVSDPETYCRVRLTDRFRLRPGAQSAATFALRGGRYLLFQLAGPTGPGFRLRPAATVAEYPLQISRPLSPADPLLAQVVDMCETTLRACLQDGFVDCVWRESSQWLGDALPQSLLMASLGDDVRPLRQVIRMAAQGAYPDGLLPSVLPGEVHAYAVVDYNFIWVELLALYRRLAGDDGLVAQVWPALHKMLDRFHQDLTPDGLLLSQPGRRLFLDWSPQSRAEPSAVYNLRYLLALQTAAQLADDRGLTTGEARLWRQRAAALQRAVRDHFWRDGRWHDDLERTTFSQLAAALALLTGSTPPESIEPQLAAIAARSLDTDDEPAPGKMVLASPFMHHYIFEALRRHKKFEAALEIIRRRWGRWVEGGYPTTWENWNVDFPDGSQCHAFSAHPRYHLAQIAAALGRL